MKYFSFRIKTVVSDDGLFKLKSNRKLFFDYNEIIGYRKNLHKNSNKNYLLANKMNEPNIAI